jgi:hypothetical protein
MDVQAAQWNAQLNRMVSLCMQEAAEYEVSAALNDVLALQLFQRRLVTPAGACYAVLLQRGRTLQVLQPSLASLLQPNQRSVVDAANAQNAGQQSASGPVQSATPSKPQEHAAGSSAGQAAAADASSGQAAASIKQEEVAANPQQTPAASKPAVADAAAVTAPFCTPMATLAGAPGAGLLPMHTPVGVKQQDGMMSMPAASAPPAAVVLSSGLNSQQMLVCNGMLRLPLQQQQQKTGEFTPAGAAAAHVTPQQFHLACPSVDAAATPALLLPALGNPLMQHMLMQQAQQQQQQQQQQTSPGVFASVITTTQPNTRKGKRRGYSIQPEALKALVARQMQAKQQPKSEQQHDPQQDPQQQHDQQQMQPPTGLQQQQLGARLQPQQQHRQRSMPRIPPLLRQPHAGASLDAAADSGLAAAAVEESPGSAVAGLMPLQLPMSLESPGAACLGLKMTCAEELEQPGVQLELDTAKLFGSAQKRLRLSICDEPHLHAARSSMGGHQQDQLTAALISPVAVPAAAAVARDAAVAALPPAGLPPAGAAAAAAAEHHTSLELPHVGLVTPSKFFAGSPVATLGGAATRGSGTGVGADVPQPVFATPSKFFSGSPVADDAAYKRGSLQETEPETPLLFGHGATSPWPPRQLAMDMQPPAVCGAGVAAAAAGSSSSVLRSSGAGMAAVNRQDASAAVGGGQPMSWVPVGSHASQPLGLMAAAHDPTGLAATPAGAAVKLGLMCTPMAAGQGGGDDGGVLDAAAAAAAPVDCLPVKGAAAAAAVAGESVSAAEGDAAAAAAAIPVGVSLTTPAGQEQQVLATPVTGV